VKRPPTLSLARAVSLLASSTMAGQALLLVLSPVLTRIYSPADFGALAVFSAVTSVVTTVASLRWELAVPLASDDEQGLDLMVLGGVSIAVVSLLAAVLLLPFGGLLVSTTETPELQPFLWCIPLAILGGGIYQLLTYWVLRTRTFGVIASSSLARSGAQGAGQLAFGFGGMGGGGLVLGQVFGQLFGCLRMLRLVRQAAGDYVLVWTRVRDSARRFRRFPLLTTPATLLNVAGRQSPTLLIAVLAGPVWAGFYALAERVVNLPMRAVGSAVAQVFYGELSRLVREGRWREGLRTFLRTSFAMLALALVPGLVLAGLGPTLFELVFGANWRLSGELARPLAALMVFQLTTSPVSQTLNLFGMQGVQLAVDAARFMAVLIVMAGAWYLTSEPQTMIIGYVAVVSALYAIIWVACLLAIVRRSAGGSP
jgi:O-antigen/teichoic acid export membrane protein